MVGLGYDRLGRRIYYALHMVFPYRYVIIKKMIRLIIRYGYTRSDSSSVYKIAYVIHMFSKPPTNKVYTRMAKEFSKK